ncbi:hypothetical protein N9Y42_01135 [Mariniblastus sp.]|nr:hypothetical protein [Mariniblastus sp.]
MRTKSLLSFLVAMLATIVIAGGCQEPVGDTDGGGAQSHDEHDHSSCDHDHDHSSCDHDHSHDGDHDHAADGDHGHDHPAHGPNHGHMFDFDSDEFTGEWCQYPDNNVIRIYLLDEKGEGSKPLVVEQFLVKPLVGSEGDPFELEPEDVDPEGAADSFMLDDMVLRTAIPLGVEIEVIADGKTLKGEIKAHKPMDH